MSIPHLLQTLGLTVLHMLWIGGLIGGVAFVWLRSNRTSAPRTRYAGAVCGLIALVVGTISTFVFLASTNSTVIVSLIDATGTSVPDGLPLTGESTAASETFDAGAATRGIAPATMIAWGWIIGIALMSARLFRQWLGVRRLRFVGIAQPPADFTRMFDSLKSRIGIHSRVSMFMSHTIDAPMVVGWLRPLVLVPAAAFTSLTPEQLRTILAHELQHIARRDHLVNMLQAFIEVVLFFHPVTWWLSRQIRIERENCCDDATLLVTGTPRNFAEALLVLDALRSNETLSPHLLAATGGSLMHRISRLFGSNQPHPLNAGWRAVSSCTLLAVAGLTFATATIDPTAVAQDRGVADAKQVDLGMSKADYDAAVEKMTEMVKAGKITREQMQQRLNRMKQAGSAKDETDGGRRMSKAAYDAAVEKMTEMVKAGKITREQMKQRLDRMQQAGSAKDKTPGGRQMSKADYDEAVKKMTEMVKAGKITREQMKKRLDRMQQSMGSTPNRDLAELKSQIEDRIKSMGVDLRQKVAAGEISESDAKARFEEGERRMWARYRAAEEKQMEEKNADANDQDLDELKAKIEERVRVMGRNLREQVAAGELSDAEARTRFAEGERRMWTRYRAAEEKAAADGMSKVDYDAAVEKMTEMVKAGKITRQQMQQRLDRMKQGAAKGKAAAGGMSKADYDAAVEKMTEMVKAGKITSQQMQQRLDRMKKAGDG